MTTYHVRAKRWELGWELHIDGSGMTRSRTLDGAEQAVRDYIYDTTGCDASADTVVITQDPGDQDPQAAVTS